MTRFQEDKARKLRCRVAALTIAQCGPFTAAELCRFLHPGIDPGFDHAFGKRVRGLKKSLHKLVTDDDLVQEGEYYALKRTARNGLVTAVLPAPPADSTIAAPTREQLMGSGRAPARARAVAA